jgi:hypothetical protein
MHFCHVRMDVSCLGFISNCYKCLGFTSNDYIYISHSTFINVISKHNQMVV